MNDFDEAKWARWGAKTCTLILWVLALGAVIFVGMTLSDLWSPEGRKLDFTYQDGSTVIKLDAMADPQLRASLQVAVGVEALVVLAAIGLGLFRLRRLLRTVEDGRAFSFEAVRDLVFLGNLLLVAAVVVPLGQNLMAWLVQMTRASPDVHYQLSPDLTFLLSGFVVRAVATVFAHGVRLEAEPETTVEH